MAVSPGRLKVVFEALASIAVIAGIPFFFYQQMHETDAKKVERAMQFVAMYNEGETSTLRAKVTDPWVNFNMAEFARAGPSPAALDKLTDDIMSSSNISRADLARLSDFYIATLACRDRKVCDAITIDAYFKDAIHGFYCIYRRPLTETASAMSRPSYLNRLREYAGSCVRHG
ncbi:hypothetical protein BH10PSE3_BH10PSE3_31340 [soil metagenome]